jgi:hypothetical protein
MKRLYELSDLMRLEMEIFSLFCSKAVCGKGKELIEVDIVQLIRRCLKKSSFELYKVWDFCIECLRMLLKALIGAKAQS